MDKNIKRINFKIIQDYIKKKFFIFQKMINIFNFILFKYIKLIINEKIFFYYFHSIFNFY